MLGQFKIAVHMRSRVQFRICVVHEHTVTRETSLILSCNSVAGHESRQRPEHPSQLYNFISLATTGINKPGRGANDGARAVVAIRGQQRYCSLK